MNLQLTRNIFCLVSLFITGCLSSEIRKLELKSSKEAFETSLEEGNRRLGIIAGSVSGGIVFIGIVISLIVACCIKANKPARRSTGAVIQPGQPSIAVTNASVSTGQPQYPMQPPHSYTGYPAKPNVNQGYPPPAKPAFYPTNVPTSNQPNPV